MLSITTASEMLWLFLVCLGMEQVQSFCPSMCHCNDSLLESRCVSSRLDTVPILLNPSLRSLDLSHNRISSLEQSFTFYSELRRLDLSHNLLHSLGSGHFETLRHLEILNVSSNVIAALESGSFSSLTTLSLLDLSDNRLSLLQNGVFSELSALKTLILSANRIKTVEQHAFQGLRHATHLYLDSNHLRHVPTNALAQLQNLRTLHLGRNSIQVVDDSSFERLTKLQELRLNDNDLRQVEPLAFHSLRAIQNLDLSFNRLLSIPAKALNPSQLENLKILDVSGNLWRHIPAGFARDFPYLEVLNISYMEYLQHVDERAFRSEQNSSALTQLVMTNNALWSYFPPSLLEPLTHLKRLDLSGNAFPTIHEPPMMPQLEFLNLAYNPLKCNCSILWLWQLLRTTASLRGDLVVVNVTCSSPNPNPISGIPPFYLEVDDLQCVTSLPFLTVVLPLLIGLWAAILVGVLVYCRLLRRRKKDLESSSGISPILTPRKRLSKKETAVRVNEDEYTFHCAGNMKRIPVTVI